MDQPTAAAVSSALVLAGFYPEVVLLDSGQWQVSTTAIDTPITVDNAQIFCQANKVSGTMPTLVFL